MTLYFQGAVNFDLAFLAGGSPSAEFTTLHNEPVWKVTSISGSAPAGVARIQEMINVSEDVVIIPVPSTFVVPGLGVAIHDRGGGATGSSPANPPLWVAWIDAGNCFGKGYYVYANRWQTIANYSWIILGHELAHVSHHIHGIQTSEYLATVAENAHRTELGLPLRSVTKYAGGCGTPSGWVPPWLAPAADWVDQVLEWTSPRKREQLPPEEPVRIPDELFRRRETGE
ncbi:hypothetical protein [Arthrobacter oryzae]|uniref:hypothetical protein n=1 Tax=Arthrobacter oryzae TaxID=409290 RepID=UPI002858FCC4|nr:hypothetical protein [Arthrobacter oryzae]MDR6507731.1 hypothetical protein [Arthrobacter oryzae]